MTNVPENIREVWKDVYILFDTHWNISNTEDDWKKFWDSAKAIYEKLPDDSFRPHVVDMITVVSEMIAEKLKEDRNPTWEQGEPYPYPKGEIKL